MSFEPKEQPVYYSPAPGASSPATAVVGTPVYQYDQGQQQQLQGTPIQGTPVYQYDQAQQQQLQGTPVQGTPVQGTPVYQYAQTSPQQPNVLQQPYYPPADMQSPPPQHQQIYYAQQPVQQQVQQPNVAYTTAQAVEAPAVTTIPVAGNGRGLTGRMHQFDECCLCFPLHTGAMIIAFLMVIFYGYCGLVLITSGVYSGKDKNEKRKLLDNMMCSLTNWTWLFLSLSLSFFFSHPLPITCCIYQQAGTRPS